MPFNQIICSFLILHRHKKGKGIIDDYFLKKVAEQTLHRLHRYSECTLRHKWEPVNFFWTIKIIKSLPNISSENVSQSYSNFIYTQIIEKVYEKD